MSWNGSLFLSLPEAGGLVLLSSSRGPGGVQEADSQTLIVLLRIRSPGEPSLSLVPLTVPQVQLSFSCFDWLSGGGPHWSAVVLFRAHACNFRAVVCSVTWLPMSVWEELSIFLFVQVFTCYCRAETPRPLTYWDGTGGKHSFREKKFILVSVLAVLLLIALQFRHVFWYDYYFGH